MGRRNIMPGITDQIIKVLSKAEGEGLTKQEVVKRVSKRFKPDVDFAIFSNTVGSILSKFARDKYLRRTGKRMGYKYHWKKSNKL